MPRVSKPPINKINIHVLRTGIGVALPGGGGVCDITVLLATAIQGGAVAAGEHSAPPLGVTLA